MPDRILVVEDDALVYRALQLLLEREQIESECLHSAEDAVRALYTASYDLMLVDIGLPGQSGLELLEQKQRIQPDLPAILITGNPTLKAARRAIQLGVKDFFQKPLYGPEILRAIRSTIQEAREERTKMRARELSLGNQMTQSLCNHFNNLLGSVIGQMSLLPEHHHLPQSLEHDFQEIVEQAKKMSDLVRRMGLFCESDVRLDSDVNPMQLLHEITDSSAHRYGRTISPPNTDITVRVDCNAHRLASLFQEMIAFVCTSSPVDTALQVTTGLESADHRPELVIRVEASGVALPPFSPEDIVSSFQATWESLNEEHLGISVAHAIAIQLEGSLQVENGSNPDSAICLRFPVRRTSDSVVEGPTIKTLAIAGCSVLVVDNNPTVLRLTCGMLKRITGAESFGVATGKEALRYLSDPGHEIGLVLMDLRLDGESGFDVYDSIRNSHPTMPVIFISGYSDDARLGETLKQDNCTSFLAKPFDIKELQKAIESRLVNSQGS